MVEHTLKAGGLVRKDPVTSVHPLIRVHPITKEKCIFLNGEFTVGFEGMKEAEFTVLRDFLLDHMIGSHDLQARVRWSPKTVVIFDNRNTIRRCLIIWRQLSVHAFPDTAVVDYMGDDNVAQPRHIFRLASMAEVPIPASRA